MTGRGPQRIHYTVCSVTSEDPDYPACDLHDPHPSNPGWHSARFCEYPQELELRLNTPARVEQLEIMAHEYKVPECIEIYVSTLPPGRTDVSQAVEKRLGRLRFNDGDRTNHHTRELKKLQELDIHAHLIRFEFPRCHVNHHNIYNQVALIAVNVVGASAPCSCALLMATCQHCELGVQHTARWLHS
jgi:centrosomal protein CEP104